MRKIHCVVLIVVLMFMNLSCSDKQTNHSDRDLDLIWQFQNDVFDLSSDIRAVEVKGDPSCIDVYVYTQYLNYEEEDLIVIIDKIAKEYELSDNNSYEINILDISTAPERMNCQ